MAIESAAVKRELSGMCVAITGASAGIGEALARALAERGARLALCARRVDRVEALARQLGDSHLAMRADVAVPEQCAAFVTEANARLGRIDTLVCNAGYGLVKPIAETSAAEWEAILRTNLLGTTECVRAAVPLMQAQSERDGWRGQIVIVSSGLARRGKPEAGAYSATKAAQLSVAEALRIELAASRIAVTSVHPVSTETEFMAVAGRSGDGWKRHPGDPVQTVEQVAEAMLRGIARPRPELWPHRLSRIALGVAGLIPGTVDRVLLRRRGRA
jgi:short-subunit dehydrogenase